MNPDISRIISFWFDRPPMEWIVAPEGLDAELKAQFSDLVGKARANELDDWATSADGSLALVVLLDQFSQNIYRDSPDAFTADEKAWETATRAIAQGLDKAVTVIQASAFYMPLMQKESLISVIAARGLFETLKARCESEEEHKWVGLGAMAAGGHTEQLLKFGRYPTRNKLLGRMNTEAEEKYLKDHIVKRVAEMKRNME
ncbi:DUF924-domain-containing protein [Lophiostoma macrostomum CBS 122681]|uniref:DUF924-domain-containing protein n=1 Tax=Lophiostoma macrostomum CBS 122681 TaxID=1314788 RepID=A0A6A6T3P1_9PLEO|nr:DUF924-domain-containing protein [Lophiostoma macrostomum CBS 122681]